MSTKWKTIPYLANMVLKMRYEPPYRSFVEMTSSPGLSILMTQSMAAKPEPKQAPCFPFSIAAIFFSKA